MDIQDKKQQLQQHCRLLADAYRAWIAEKNKHSALMFADQNGNLVERNTDGSQRIVKYAE